MGARGRQPASALSVATPSPVSAHERPEPPLDLTEAEADVWIGVVDSLPADWWLAANLPLLAQYCRHVVGARLVAALIERLGASDEVDVEALVKLSAVQAKHTAAMKALAASMRLSQQASYSARGAAGAKGKQPTGDRPWS